MQTRNTFAMKLFTVLLPIVVGVVGATSASAAPVFFDDFTSGASPLWSNTAGGWVAAGGEYYASVPPNPPAFTRIPIDLTDFSMDVDVRQVEKGGVWLRADATGNNAVLLAWGDGFESSGGLYWHVYQGGYDAGANPGGSGINGTDIHIHVEVIGNTYQAFLNGASTPTTTFTYSGFSHGYVGLFDNSLGIYNGHPGEGQTYDNFQVSVPEPASLALLSLGLFGLGFSRRKKA